MPFTNQQNKNYVGQGIIFPITLQKGKPNLETGLPLIKSSLQILLGWDYPKRFFLPEYNSRLKELLEEPNDDLLLNILEGFTIDAIEKWEKRVELISVSFKRVDNRTINAELKYKITNTQEVDSFIFPFYKEIIY